MRMRYNTFLCDPLCLKGCIKSVMCNERTHAPLLNSPPSIRHGRMPVASLASVCPPLARLRRASRNPALRFSAVGGSAFGGRGGPALRSLGVGGVCLLAVAKSFLGSLVWLGSGRPIGGSRTDLGSWGKYPRYSYPDNTLKYQLSRAGPVPSFRDFAALRVIRLFGFPP